jgi:tetratricopeptide (TPR) repeat protein
MLNLRLKKTSAVATSVVMTSILLSISGCAGDAVDKKAQEPATSSKGEAAPSGNTAASSSIGGERRFLVTSLSNNSMTSRSIERSRAADFIAQDGNAKSKDLNMLAAVVSANRLAGRSAEETMVGAKAIADIEMSKNVDREVPESVQLELGLTGVQTGRLAFAEFWLDKLLKSKSPGIRASALNAKGVMALRMERIPEAMILFKDAVAVSPDYKPALLNIGFLALQGGDGVTAQKALGAVQDDWYADAGLISVLRLQGDVDKADASCDKILAGHPKHKPTLINCGINAWQGKKNYAKARDLINKSLAVAGGTAVWDEKSGRLLGAIDAEEARANQAKSLKEAADRKAEKDKTAQPDAAGGPKPAQPAGGAEEKPK